MPEREEPLLIDEREAARLLGISPRTLYTLRKNGDVPYVQLGKHCIRYELKDIKALVAQKKTGAAKDASSDRSRQQNGVRPSVPHDLQNGRC